MFILWVKESQSMLSLIVCRSGGGRWTCKLRRADSRQRTSGMLEAAEGRRTSSKMGAVFLGEQARGRQVLFFFVYQSRVIRRRGRYTHFMMGFQLHVHNVASRAAS